MSFLTQGKTNWKFLLIVVILAVIVGGGLLIWQYNLTEKSSVFILTPMPQAKLTPQPVPTPEVKKQQEVMVFDVSHNNRNNYDYSEFLNIFKGAGFEVKLITDEINEENLKNANTLFITIHTSDYIQSELNEINKFLKTGGNLIVLGDFVNDYDINRVISPLGVKLISCSGEWDVFPFAEHPLVENVQRLSLAAYNCLDIENQSFKVIADVPEYPVIAIREDGNKILISGDANVCDDYYIKMANNSVFCKNIASWIKKSEEKKDEIFDWNIYINYKLRYQIKYPLYLFVQTPGLYTDNGNTYFYVSPEDSTLTGEQSYIRIQIGENPEALKLENWVYSSYNSLLSREGWCIQEIGTTLRLASSCDYNTWEYKHDLASFGTKVVIISTIGSSKKFNLFEISKEMLSTFRFIEILTPEEQLIEKIADEIIPEGFDKEVRKPDDYFSLHGLRYTFEDLNGDGKEEVILVTSAFESSHEGIERIFIGVATISDNQQNYKKVAGLEHKVGYADTLYTPDFHDFEDIDEDGQKEMFLIHRSAVTMQNNYSYCIFDVDFIKEEIKPFDECFSEWSGALGFNMFYLEDIDKDGKREFVEIVSGFSNEPTPKEYCEVKVYKWDGLKLSHNEQLSSLILEEKCKDYLEE